MKANSKITFMPGVPKEVITACKKTFLEYECLIPNWVNEVLVHWDTMTTSGGDGGLIAAYVDTSYAYRNASIFLCPAILLCDEKERDEKIRHELLHIVTSPLINYVRSVIDTVCKDETICELVHRESSEKIESTTEDLRILVDALEQALKSKYGK